MRPYLINKSHIAKFIRTNADDMQASEHVQAWFMSVYYNHVVRNIDKYSIPVKVQKYSRFTTGVILNQDYGPVRYVKMRSYADNHKQGHGLHIVPDPDYMRYDHAKVLRNEGYAVAFIVQDADDLVTIRDWMHNNSAKLPKDLTRLSYYDAIKRARTWHSATARQFMLSDSGFAGLLNERAYADVARRAGMGIFRRALALPVDLLGHDNTRPLPERFPVERRVDMVFRDDFFSISLVAQPFDISINWTLNPPKPRPLNQTYLTDAPKGTRKFVGTAYGWSIFSLGDAEALRYESLLQHHCVGWSNSRYLERVEKGTALILHLSKDTAKFTVEVQIKRLKEYARTDKHKLLEYDANRNRIGPLEDCWVIKQIKEYDNAEPEAWQRKEIEQALAIMRDHFQGLPLNETK